MENLDLINWGELFFGSLWISGLAVILSVFGFVDYHSKRRKIRFKMELRHPRYQAWLNVGLSLFSLGLMGTSDAWWETTLWAILTIAFVWFSILSYRQAKSHASNKGR